MFNNNFNVFSSLDATASRKPGEIKSIAQNKVDPLNIAWSGKVG